MYPCSFLPMIYFSSVIYAFKMHKKLTFDLVSNMKPQVSSVKDIASSNFLTSPLFDKIVVNFSKCE